MHCFSTRLPAPVNDRQPTGQPARDGSVSSHRQYDFRRAVVNGEPYTQVDSFEMKMNGHFPCVIAEIDDRKLRLGIDTGAEVNVFIQRIFRKTQLQLEAESSVILRGVKNESQV